MYGRDARRFSVVLGLITVVFGCVGAPPEPKAADAEFEGVGAIRFGMTIDEAAAAMQVTAPAVDSTCHYWTPPGAPSGLRLMIENERVTRADVDSAGVATLHGLEVGSPVDSVRAAFGSGLHEIPHKYQWETGWRYLTVASSDSVYGLRFEADSHAVRRFRTGFRAAVEYVEGCG